MRKCFIDSRIKCSYPPGYCTRCKIFNDHGQKTLTDFFKTSSQTEHQ